RIVVIVAIFLMYFFTTFYSKNWIPSLVLIVLFPALFYLGKDRAYEQAQRIRVGYAKPISFQFKKDTSKHYPKEFLEANNKGDLKLITQTNDRFYVLYQHVDRGDEIPYGYTYDISRDDILLPTINLQNIP